MKNEVGFSPSLSGWNLSANNPARQAPPARSRAKNKTWRIPPTPEYLGALREANEAVVQFIVKHVALNQNARTARFAKN